MEMYIQLSAENMLGLDLRRVFKVHPTTSCEHMVLRPYQPATMTFTARTDYHPNHYVCPNLSITAVLSLPFQYSSSSCYLLLLATL